MLHNFLELPEPCWFVIFKRLPTVDVLQINLVCRLLNQLQISYLKSKTSLRIDFMKLSKSPPRWNDFTLYNTLGQADFTAKYQEPPDNDNYYYDEVDVRNGVTEYEPDPFEMNQGELCAYRPKFDLKFTSENVAVLAHKLPNIKRLTIADHRSRSCLQFEENILEYWPELTHLSIIPSSWKNLDIELLESINKLSSIKHLAVTADIGILKHLTIRNQLQEFHAIYYYARFENREKTKLQDRQSLALINELFADPEKNFGVFISRTILNNDVFSLSCVNKINRLSFEPESLKELNKICSSLTQLSYLELLINREPGVADLSITNFLDPVSQLKNLKYLQIRTPEVQKYQFIYANQQCPVLESVKEVHFHLLISAHTTVKVIRAQFPNANKITLQLAPKQQIEFLKYVCNEPQCDICQQFRQFYEVLPVLLSSLVIFDLAPAQLAITVLDPPRYQYA